MKKILFIIALFCISLSSNVNAQCTPDGSATGDITPAGGSPIAAGKIDSVYAQTFTLIVPADTMLGGFTFTINDATVTDVVGLPAGLFYTCNGNNCVYNGGTTGCLIIEGTPTVFGTFSIVIKADVNATGVPLPLPFDSNYDIIIADTATGCALTIVASAGNETVAGANDGSASVIASNGTGPYAYLWSTGATTISISGLTPGNYSVTVTDAASCTAVDAVTVNAGPTSINTVEGTTFEVYPVTPNPSSTRAEIRFIVSEYKDVSVSVHNMIGAVVLSKKIYAEKGLNIVSLNAEDLNPGVYFVTLTDGVNTSTRRMVVGAK